MLIQLFIETTQPLTGTAVGTAQQTVAFVGWLDLLRAVSELTDAAQQTEPDRRWDVVVLNERREERDR